LGGTHDSGDGDQAHSYSSGHGDRRLDAARIAGRVRTTRAAPGTPALARILSGALGVAVALGLAIVFIWIGFGPGERHFTGSGAFLGPLVGRAMFGLFGLLTFVVVCWVEVRRLKRGLAAKDNT
jgi:hypothetical protein